MGCILPISIPIWLILFVILGVGGLIQGALPVITGFLAWAFLIIVCIGVGIVWFCVGSIGFAGAADDDDAIPGKRRDSLFLELHPIICAVVGFVASVYLSWCLVFSEDGDAAFSLVLFWIAFTVVLGGLLLFCLGRSLVSVVVRTVLLTAAPLFVLLWAIGCNTTVNAIKQYENIAYYDVIHVPELGFRRIRDGEEGIDDEALYIYDTPSHDAYNYNCPLDGPKVVAELHEGDHATPLLSEKAKHTDGIWYPIVLEDGSTGWLWTNFDSEENPINIVYSLDGPNTDALVKAEVETHWYRFLPEPVIDLGMRLFQAMPLWFGWSLHVA